MVQKVIWLNLWQSFLSILNENALSFWCAVNKFSIMSADGIAPADVPAKSSLKKGYLQVEINISSKLLI